MYRSTCLAFFEENPHRSRAECAIIAHRHSLAIFTAYLGIARNSAVGISLVPFNHRESRRLLAIVIARKLRILEP